MAALNFGAAGSSPAVTLPPSEAAPWAWGMVLVPFALSGFLVLLLDRPKARGAAWRPPVTVAGLPVEGKLLVFFYLLATALTHAFAMGAVYQATQVAMSDSAEYFRLVMKPLQLFRMSHQHAFGHGTMYFLLGAIAVCTTASRRLKLLGISLTSVGALCDLASWWLQHYAGPDYHPLSVGAGAAFSLGYALLAGLVFVDLIKKKGEKKGGTRRREGHL